MFASSCKCLQVFESFSELLVSSFVFLQVIAIF